MDEKEKIEIDFDFAPKGIAIIRQIVREELLKVFAERDAEEEEEGRKYVLNYYLKAIKHGDVDYLKPMFEGQFPDLVQTCPDVVGDFNNQIVKNQAVKFLESVLGV